MAIPPLFNLISFISSTREISFFSFSPRFDEHFVTLDVLLQNIETHHFHICRHGYCAGDIEYEVEVAL
jgi:hypothetical protein